MQRALAEIGPLVAGSIEVLAVDDGSTDRTPQLADALAAADPRVRVFHQPNRGYGGALKAGFEHASGELIGFSDGDLQFDLREMSRLLDRLADDRKPVDAVIGYRIKRRDPFHRIFIAKTYNAIVSVAFGLRVRDIDCAMKLFRREVFDGLRARRRRPVPLRGAADQAAGARRADGAGRSDPLSRGRRARTPGRASGRSCAPSATSARLRWALWTRRRRGAQHAAAERGQAPSSSARRALLAALQVDVERVHELAEDGQLLIGSSPGPALSGSTPASSRTRSST